MKFGKSLQDGARQEWRDKYINYISLKKKLWEVRDEVDNPHSNPAVLEAKRAIFQGYLDSEIEKVVLWYKSSLESLHANAKTLEHDLALAPNIFGDANIATEFKLSGISTLRSRWRTVATELASLLEYVSLNMIAMRKILKKYAKHVEPTKPMDGYCTLEIQHPDEPGWAFVQGTFLPDYVAEELDLMQNDPAVLDIQERTEVALGYLQMIRKLVVSKSRETGGESAKVSVEVPPLFGSDRRTERHASLTRQETLHHTSADEQNILRQIDIAANQARVSSMLVRSKPWSVATAGIFEEPPGDSAAMGDNAGLWITLTLAFIHSCVYYMPTPTLHNLCRDLDVDLAYGVLVFAVADVGEILSAFGYTFWTNTHYRDPLLCSAMCGLIGCILCSFAFLVPAGGFITVLAGRFLIGTASARTICRRYIADCIPLADRTLASLGIVVASSMGMAVGNLISIPILKSGRIEIADNLIEPVEILGWLGAFLWGTSLCAAILFFNDPQVRLNQGSATGSSHEVMASLLEEGHKSEDVPSEAQQRVSGTELLMARTSWTDAPQHTSHSSDWDDSPLSSGRPASHSRRDPRMMLQRVLGSSNVPWEEFHKALMPTVCCFCCLSLFKFALAIFSSSLPLFSHGTLWYWKDLNRAVVLGMLAFTTLPAGYFVALMSASLSDRRILAISVAATAAACTPLYQLGPNAWHKGLYIVGGIALHMSVVGIEGSSMSLLSKVIHPSMARGPVNCGLLTTVAGTVGRLLGNLLVIALARLVTVDSDSPEFELLTFAHVLYGTLSMTMCANLLYVLYMYQRLK